MASDIFIWFEQPGSGAIAVEGETTDTEFKPKKAIEIDRLNWGLHNYADIGSASGGGGQSKISFQSLSFTKPVDRSSLGLQAACWSGGHYGLATIAVRRAGAEKEKAGTTFLQVKMKQVFVTNIGFGGAGDDVPIEQVTLAVGAVEIEYTPQLATGARGATKMMHWSQIENRDTF